MFGDFYFILCSKDFSRIKIIWKKFCIFKANNLAFIQIFIIEGINFFLSPTISKFFNYIPFDIIYFYHLITIARYYYKLIYVLFLSCKKQQEESKTYSNNQDFSILPLKFNIHSKLSIFQSLMLLSFDNDKIKFFLFSFS